MSNIIYQNHKKYGYAELVKADIWCDGFLKELGSEKLKDFQLDPRSYGFGSLISFLRAECDNFSEDYQNEEFYDSIKDCFLKLQKALNEEWGIISLFLIILFLIFMHIKLTYFSFYLAKGTIPILNLFSVFGGIYFGLSEHIWILWPLHRNIPFLSANNIILLEYTLKRHLLSSD